MENVEPLLPTVSVQPKITVEIEAPSNLPEGYEFDAKLNGSTFKVVVPKGGVVKGQRFHVPVTLQNTSKPSEGQVSKKPVGKWRDGLCDCFSLGCFHPVCCLAYWCTPILMGQVLGRSGLDWLGSPTTAANAATTCKKTTLIAVISFVLTTWYFVYQFQYVGLLMDYIANLNANLNANSNESPYYPPPQPTDPTPPMLKAATFMACIYIMVVVIRLRYNLREQHAIPERNCIGCEDCCVAYWCGCCTISQMARHTADYSEERAYCCTDNGLDPVLEKA